MMARLTHARCPRDAPACLQDRRTATDCTPHVDARPDALSAHVPTDVRTRGLAARHQSTYIHWCLLLEMSWAFCMGLIVGVGATLGGRWQEGTSGRERARPDR